LYYTHLSATDYPLQKTYTQNILGHALTHTTTNLFTWIKRNWTSKWNNIYW